MPKTVTKAADNIYTKTRLKAAEKDETFKSREKASEQLGLSSASLAKYELGGCKVVPEDVVVMMADGYNAPELLSEYCAQCPVGQARNITALQDKPIELVAIQILNSLRNTEKIKENLIDITADGIITKDELPKLNEIINTLEQIIKTANELKLYAMKRKKEF